MSMYMCMYEGGWEGMGGREERVEEEEEEEEESRGHCK